MSDRLERLQQSFDGERQQVLAAVARVLEQFPTSRSLGDAPLHLHTLKGSARLLGLDAMARHIHQLEEELLALPGLEPSHQRSRLTALRAQLHELEGERAPTPKQTTSLEETVASSGRLAPELAQTLLLSATNLQDLQTRCERLLAAETGLMEGRLWQDFQQRLARETNELGELAFQLTLRQAQELLAGLPEMVHKLAGVQHKQVDLAVDVPSTFVLREHMLELRPVLLHLVSNAIVHGVEPPRQREQAGKEPSGRIEVGVRRRQSGLEVWVQDDGAGLARDRLGERVVALGHLSTDQWESLSPDEMASWLFEVGVTTRLASDLDAGRGLGLAAVRQAVRRLGGDIVCRVLEAGLRFELRVPAPWEYEEVLLVTSGGREFAVLARSLSHVSYHREQQAPSLSFLLGYEEVAGNETNLLHIREPQHQATASVAECGRYRQLVISPIPEIEGLPAAVSGVAHRGGAPLFLLDLAKLGTRVGASPPPAEAGRSSTILVVDDSVTTRSVVLGVMGRAGYHTLSAANGQEALELLEQESVDLIVSDLQMPVLDGLGLLERLRALAPPLSSLPFILLTSKDDPASFRKALTIGADRCVAKQAFEEKKMLDLVAELL
ncbi:MAG: response regulator [Vulcanimicrobiota bacterium]